MNKFMRRTHVEYILKLKFVNYPPEMSVMYCYILHRYITPYLSHFRGASLQRTCLGREYHLKNDNSNDENDDDW